MTPVGKASLLAAQLLAHHKEEVSIHAINRGLELSHRTDHLKVRMHRELVRIALEKGCQEEFAGAREVVRMVCMVLNLDAKEVLGRADDVINRAYMGEAA